MKNRTFLIITALTALIVAICIRWIDYPLASLLGHGQSHVLKVEIPDVLFPGCLLLAAAAWIMYRYSSKTGRWPSIAPLSKTIAIITPIVFIVKELAQHFFGRVLPREVLMHQNLAEFRSFHPNPLLGGLPSGHMMIAVSLLLVFSRYTRLPRLVWLALGIALGSALVATNYHFLSDVIAGAYGGFVVEKFTHKFTKRPDLGRA